MKKQSQNSKLAFNKAVISELNDAQMENIDGGTTVPCVGVFVASVALSYNISKDVFN